MTNARSYPENDPLLSVCAFKTSPCVRSKRACVYRHHANMLKHMCAWCRHTRERFGRTHGGHTQTHAHTDTRTDTHRHTQKRRTCRTHTDRRTENTQHAGPKQDKNNDFSNKKNDVLLTHRKMSSAQRHFFQMSVAGRPAWARAAGAPWTHNVA